MGPNDTCLIRCFWCSNDDPRMMDLVNVTKVTPLNLTPKEEYFCRVCGRSTYYDVETQNGQENPHPQVLPNDPNP